MRKIIVAGIGFFTAVITALVINGCSETQADTNTRGEVPAVYTKLYGVYDTYTDGDYLIARSKGMPDHSTPYYRDTEWESSRYEDYSGSNSRFRLNPHRIDEQDLIFRIPLNPVKSNNHTNTPMGPIGISLNGIPFFNQYAAGGSPLTGEINSFDQYNGHPQRSDMYHYHIEPLYLTEVYGRDALLGFLLDGFPVYGPEENGKAITNGDLDAYHGHSGVTADYPDGIYHYHITDEAPYLNGDGFYGVPGTVNR